MVAIMVSLMIFLNLCSASNDGELFDFTNAKYRGKNAFGDSWGTGKNDPFDTTSKAVEKHLKDNSPEITGIALEDNRKEGVLECQACTCPAWIRIFVDIVENYSKKIEALGFTRYKVGQ